MRLDHVRSLGSNVKRRVALYRLRQVQDEVLTTPPLQMRDAPLCFLSMVSHRDLSSYLCAIKSIYRFFDEGRVIVINDGSLTDLDQAILRHHLPLSTVIPIGSIDVGRCPTGGTWERLVQILEETTTSYVIQVDADTLAIADIEQAVQAYHQNRSFLLGTDLGQSFEPVAAVAQLVQNQLAAYMHKIGCLSEAAQVRLPNADRLLYCRGSSGFAGFAREAFDPQQLQSYSVYMESMLGTRWHEWGSEQTASNFMIANAPDAVVLSFAKYACFEPGVDIEGKAFLHFIGTFRTLGRTYERLSRDFLSTVVNNNARPPVRSARLSIGRVKPSF